MTAQPTVVARVRSTAVAISHRTGVDVDDLKQEGMIAAWHAEEDFDPSQGSLEARQVFKAKTAMLDYCRSTSLGRQQQDVGVYRRLGERQLRRLRRNRARAVQPVAEENAYLGEIVDVIDRRVKPSYANALLATTLGGMTQQEYADATGVTFGRVSQLVKCAAQGVRKALIK